MIWANQDGKRLAKLEYLIINLKCGLSTHHNNRNRLKKERQSSLYWSPEIAEYIAEKEPKIWEDIQGRVRIEN